MTQKLIPMAICYDFDKTLLPEYTTDYGFLQAIGMDRNKFQERFGSEIKKYAGDFTVVFLKLILDLLKEHGLSTKEADIQEFSKNLAFFPGLLTWFDRINAYALTCGIKMEHFIISAGLRELIEKCKIAPYFREIFASSYLYDDNGDAAWPRVCINDANKTQYLFRISKGILDVTDMSINRRMKHHDRAVHFENMIYIGDGDTDIPCMTVVKERGGHSIAVFDPNDLMAESIATHFLSEDRVNVVAPADYSEGSEIDLFVKGVIEMRSKRDL